MSEPTPADAKARRRVILAGGVEATLVGVGIPPDKRHGSSRRRTLTAGTARVLIGSRHRVVTVDTIVEVLP